MRQLDTDSLRFFVQVLDSSSIAAAAERVHLTPAAISKRMSLLEEALSTQLLVRTNKGVVPTQAGEALLDLARRALNELDQIPLHMCGYQSGVRGLVRICTSASATVPKLIRTLSTFALKYPDVHVQHQDQNSAMAVRAVRENRADICIFTQLTVGHDLETFDYGEDRLVLIVPKGHALAARGSIRIDEALDDTFVGFSQEGAIYRALTLAADAARKPLVQRIQVNRFDTLCQLVGNGAGISVAPDSIAQRNARVFGIELVTIDEPWAVRRFRVGVRSTSVLPQAARRLLSMLTSGDEESVPSPDD